MVKGLGLRAEGCRFKAHYHHRWSPERGTLTLGRSLKERPFVNNINKVRQRDRMEQTPAAVAVDTHIRWSGCVSDRRIKTSEKATLITITTAASQQTTDKRSRAGAQIFCKGN